MAAKYHFEPTQHSLRILGVCAACRREVRERKKQESAAQPHVRVAAVAQRAD
jgi:hypothetical protein